MAQRSAFCTPDDACCEKRGDHCQRSTVSARCHDLFARRRRRTRVARISVQQNRPIGVVLRAHRSLDCRRASPLTRLSARLTAHSIVGAPHRSLDCRRASPLTARPSAHSIVGAPHRSLDRQHAFGFRLSAFGSREVRATSFTSLEVKHAEEEQRRYAKRIRGRTTGEVLGLAPSAPASASSIRRPPRRGPGKSRSSTIG